MQAWIRSIGALLIMGFLSPSFTVGQDVRIRTVSSRPDTVSGDDVLAEVDAPIDKRWIALLNGHDVTRSFRVSESSSMHVAVLKGLRPGQNLLILRIQGLPESRLRIINHPITGPIFSGPHQNPFVCETVANGVGPALDSDCTARTVVQYLYKSTEAAPPAAPIQAPDEGKPFDSWPGFRTYDPSTSPPSTKVMQTVTSDGRAVPFIVRREIGTINRAVYEIKFLHQPGKPLPTPWTRGDGAWNGRLIYLFGGGCTAGYHQGTLESTSDDFLLSLGYAVATSTLNVPGNNCNDDLSAETLSMVKEHFIKQYGEPVHTMGLGGSGGSIHVYLIAQNHPGLLDGIIPFDSFPDVLTTVQSTADCALLAHAFETSDPPWTEEQKSAVSGFANWRVCYSWTWEHFLDPKQCDSSIPKDSIYDRLANVGGARCTVYDNEINVLGRDPHTGFAYRPLDNIGVQYGLAAFNRGQINAEQFISLNERIGGLDSDGGVVTSRTQAEPGALHNAYRRGLVLTGRGGLETIPIIDWRAYSDDLGDKHDLFRSFVTRARLLSSNGTAGNQVILVDPRYDFYALLNGWSGVDRVTKEALHKLVPQMDRWLDAIEADTALGETPAVRVARNKPASLADSCVKTDGERIVEQVSIEGRRICNQLYPPHADPRVAAGAPLTDDVLKCALKPVTQADYTHALTPHQLAHLRTVFPTGVCDYSKPGLGQ